MTRNTFGVDTAYPPPPPSVPGWPPPPGGQPPSGGSRRRLWPLLVTAGVVGALAASAVAAVVTLQVRDADAPAARSAPPTTVTVAPPAPPTPQSLPSAQANRESCETRSVASRLIDDAAAAQGVIAEGMTISDPAVQSNAAWKAGVQQAGRLYEQAGNSLRVTPGTTPVVADAITTASNALRALGTAYTTFDAVNGNTYTIAREASTAMDAICDRPQ